MRPLPRPRRAHRIAFHPGAEGLETRALLSAGRLLHLVGASPADVSRHDHALAIRSHRAALHAASVHRGAHGLHGALSAVRPALGRMHTFLEFAPFGHSSPSPNTSAPSSTAFNPTQIRAAYGFNNISFASYTSANSLPLPGAGQTIAIVDAYDDPNIASDLQAFDTYYKIPAPPSFTKLNQNGSTGSLPGRDRTGGWEMEEALDVEWAHAIAPGANIVLVEARSSGTGDLLTAVQTAANYSGVSVVSMSWGGGEFSSESSYDSTFTTPSGHTPDSFVVSSGDYGAPVSWPAASPNVLAVGGTSLTLNADSSWNSESGWSGSGGGLSKGYEPQPAYQQGIVTQSSTARANPDVAYNASPSPGFSIYDSYAYNGRTYNWTYVGGTSAGAPQWAALIAIADQGRLASGTTGTTTLTTTATQATPAGSALAQSVLYNLFLTSGYNTSYFHDVATGTSTGNPNYSAQSNYDLVTGLGTPHADQIATALVSPPPTAAFGAPANLTATADNAGPIALSWTPVRGATAYDVYQTDATGATATYLFTTTSNSTENTGVAPGQTYYYEVVARSATQTSGYSNVASATAATKSLFSDAFNGSQATSNWTPVGPSGAWQFNETSTDKSTTSGGITVPLPANGLSQTNSTTDADPQKAVITAAGTQASSSTPSQMISAQFEVTSWKPGEFARAGVGLDSNATTGSGFNFVIRDNPNISNDNQPDLLQFLDDGVAWGNSYAVTIPLNTWYNIRMESSGSVLYANVWAANTSEPATWQYVQAGWTDRTGGAPALNGSSVGTFTNQSQSGATVSFRNVAVTGG